MHLYMSRDIVFKISVYKCWLYFYVIGLFDKPKGRLISTGLQCKNTKKFDPQPSFLGESLFAATSEYIFLKQLFSNVIKVLIWCKHFNWSVLITRQVEIKKKGNSLNMYRNCSAFNHAVNGNTPSYHKCFLLNQEVYG